jgi:hypothetical protein
VKNMTRNMGTRDRLLRGLVVAPTALTVAGLVGATSLLGLALLAAAAVMVATAATGFCPLYVLLGVDTRGGAGTDGPARHRPGTAVTTHSGQGSGRR